MLAATLAALLLSTPLPVSAHPIAAQTVGSPVRQADNEPQDAVRLEDLTVTGRPLDQLIEIAPSIRRAHERLRTTSDEED